MRSCSTSSAWSSRAAPIPAPGRSGTWGIFDCWTPFAMGLHRSISWASEVPLPITGDQRAWDGLIWTAEWRFGVEAETAPRDAQALIRRIQLKARDGPVDGVLLVVPITRAVKEFSRWSGSRPAGGVPRPGSACSRAAWRGHQPRQKRACGRAGPGQAPAANPRCMRRQQLRARPAEADLAGRILPRGASERRGSRPRGRRWPRTGLACPRRNGCALASEVAVAWRNDIRLACPRRKQPRGRPRGRPAGAQPRQGRKAAGRPRGRPRSEG